MALSDEDVRQILQIIDESDLAEIKVETDGFSLYVRRGGTAGRSAPAADNQLTVQAPMLGTFYRAEGPGQKPFVDVGSQVEADTTVCIIEVMKMMNSVPSGVAGTVVEILAENAE